jgi:hypothetical protein
MYMLEQTQPSKDHDRPLQNLDSEETLSCFKLNLFPWQGATWLGEEDKMETMSQHTFSERLGLAGNRFLSVSMRHDLPIPSWMPVLNCEIPDEAQLQSVTEVMDVAGNSDPTQVLEEIEKKGLLSKLIFQLTDVLQNAVNKRVHNLPRPHLFENTAEKVNSFQPQFEHPRSEHDAKFQDDCEITPEHCMMQGGCEDKRSPPLEGLRSAYFAVLFSGGIDSTVLAALADRFVFKMPSCLFTVCCPTSHVCSYRVEIKVDLT